MLKFAYLHVAINVIVFALAHPKTGVSFAQENDLTSWPYGGIPDSTSKYYYFDQISDIYEPIPILNFYTASFDSIHFDKVADFRGARFNGPVSFVGARFDSLANFRGAHFYSLADFSNAKFYDLIDFGDTSFDSLANFSNVLFDSVSLFLNAKFHGLSKFNDASFNNLRIPAETCQPFRRKLPLIPAETCRLFRTKPATCEVFS